MVNTFSLNAYAPNWVKIGILEATVHSEVTGAGGPIQGATARVEAIDKRARVIIEHPDYTITSKPARNIRHMNNWARDFNKRSERGVELEVWRKKREEKAGVKAAKPQGVISERRELGLGIFSAVCALLLLWALFAVVTAGGHYLVLLLFVLPALAGAVYTAWDAPQKKLRDSEGNRIKAGSPEFEQYVNNMEKDLGINPWK